MRGPRSEGGTTEPPHCHGCSRVVQERHGRCGVRAVDSRKKYERAVKLFGAGQHQAVVLLAAAKGALSGLVGEPCAPCQGGENQTTNQTSEQARWFAAGSDVQHLYTLPTREPSGLLVVVLAACGNVGTTNQHTNSDTHARTQTTKQPNNQTTKRPTDRPNDRPTNQPTNLTITTTTTTTTTTSTSTFESCSLPSRWPNPISTSTLHNPFGCHRFSKEK